MKHRAGPGETMHRPIDANYAGLHRAGEEFRPHSGAQVWALALAVAVLLLAGVVLVA